MASLQPREQKQLPPRQALVVCALVTVAGLTLLGMAGYWWIQRSDAEHWPAVEAEILELELVTRHDPDHPGGRRQSMRCVYEYQWRGQTYTSSRVRIEVASGFSQDHWRTLKSRHDAGRPVLAYVNPDAPNEAVLFRTASSESYTVPLAGLLFAGVGLYGFIQSARRYARG